MVLGDHQLFRGYTLLLHREHHTELHQLARADRLRFLDEMAIVSEAVHRAFQAEKMNLELLGNGDALRTQLHRLLGMEQAGEVKTLRSRFHQWAKRRLAFRQQAPVSEEIVSTHDFREQTGDSHGAAIPTPGAARKRSRGASRRRSSGSLLSRKQRVGLAIIALVLACFIWLYVQVTVNPVTTKTFTVPLAHFGVDRAGEKGFGIQGYPVTNVQITLRGRQQVLADITLAKISAYIDVSDVSRTGPIQLPVKVDTDTLLYTKTELLFPATVTVNIFELD